MPSSTSVAAWSSSRRRGAQLDLVGSVIRRAGCLALQAVGGFHTLSGTADNDSLLRLVQMRDLIAGQGWFDIINTAWA